jgi:flagellar basal-body rod protein FlgB
MHESLEVFRTAQSLARHAAARQAVIARNVAHADTPGYRPRDLAPFRPLSSDAPPAPDTAGLPRHLAAAVAERAALVTERAARAGASAHPRTAALIAATRPAVEEIAAPGDGTAPNGNAVSLEAELVRAAEARSRHDLALTIYRSATGLIRAAIAR